MTDEQIEKLIWNEIKKRDVTFYDMVGLPSCGVDTDPEDKTTPINQKIRSNRFNEICGSERMKELLCVEEYNPYDDYSPLKIPFQYLFSFWWNRCVERHLVVDEILEDIYEYFKEQMRPPEKKKKIMDMEVDFSQLPLFMNDLEQAA